MSDVIMCDRCGKLMTTKFEAWQIHITKFGIMDDLDVCRGCKREFDNLYRDWLREGRAKS